MTLVPGNIRRVRIFAGGSSGKWQILVLRYKKEQTRYKRVFLSGRRLMNIISSITATVIRTAPNADTAMVTTMNGFERILLMSSPTSK